MKEKRRSTGLSPWNFYLFSFLFNLSSSMLPAIAGSMDAFRANP